MNEPQKPGGRPATGRAIPTATSQPRPASPRTRAPAPSGGQASQGQGENYPPPEGQEEGGSLNLAQSGAPFLPSGSSGGGTAPQGGLVRDLCRQSIDWHAYALQQILGVDVTELAEVLREAADQLGGGQGQ